MADVGEKGKEQVETMRWIKLKLQFGCICTVIWFELLQGLIRRGINDNRSFSHKTIIVFQISEQPRFLASMHWMQLGFEFEKNLRGGFGPWALWWHFIAMDLELISAC